MGHVVSVLDLAMGDEGFAGGFRLVLVVLVSVGFALQLLLVLEFVLLLAVLVEMSWFFAIAAIPEFRFPYGGWSTVCITLLGIVAAKKASARDIGVVCVGELVLTESSSDLALGAPDVAFRVAKLEFDLEGIGDIR